MGFRAVGLQGYSGRLLGQEWPIKYFTKLRQDNSVSVSVDTCGVSEDGD